MQLSDAKAGNLVNRPIRAKVLSYQQYFPFGWAMPGRSVSPDRMRETFQGQEQDREWLGGNAIVFTHRIEDPRLGRFLSVDPLESEYLWNSPYIFSENMVVHAIELEGLEAFFIHGSGATSRRWKKTVENSKGEVKESGPRAVKAYMKLTTNKTADVGFNWNAPLYNGPAMRNRAAKKLARYVLKNRVEGEDITLIGHSHGGNVAIQAAKYIKEKLKGEKVNIITIGTPTSANKKGGPNTGIIEAENPSAPENVDAINDHIHIWTPKDNVLMDKGVFDPFASDKTYEQLPENTQQYELALPEWLEKTHSHDLTHPQALEQAVERGDIQRLEPVKKKKD